MEIVSKLLYLVVFCYLVLRSFKYLKIDYKKYIYFFFEYLFYKGVYLYKFLYIWLLLVNMIKIEGNLRYKYIINLCWN